MNVKYSVQNFQVGRGKEKLLSASPESSVFNFKSDALLDPPHRGGANTRLGVMSLTRKRYHDK